MVAKKLTNTVTLKYLNDVKTAGKYLMLIMKAWMKMIKMKPRTAWKVVKFLSGFQIRIGIPAKITTKILKRFIKWEPIR